ncbi:MAG TPA: hypothetical protein VMA37_04805 [Acetobacteraceae bacterium]|nr:hypothetical protein [Acetobacteraceae bacterium]
MSGTLIDSAAYTPNSVPSLLQTDAVEGQGAGASHGGIGNSNAASQTLANRTAFLFGRQNTNIANIATLQGQMSQVLNVNLQPHSVRNFFLQTFPAGTLLGNNSGAANLLTANFTLPSQSTTGMFRIFCRATFQGSISATEGGGIGASTMGIRLAENSNDGQDVFHDISSHLICGFPADTFGIAEGDFAQALYAPGQSSSMVLQFNADFTGLIDTIAVLQASITLTAVPG